MRQNRHSVRVRLTAWYTAALAVIILVFSVGIYVFVRSSLLKHLDRELDVDFAAIETLLCEEPDELEELDEYGAIRLFQVIEDEEMIYGTVGWQNTQLDKAVKSSHSDSRWTWTSPKGEPYRLREVHLQIQDQTYVVTVAQPAKTIYSGLRILSMTLVIGLPCVLALAVIGGYFLAGRVLSPVGAMAAKARQITAERLSERLPVHNPNDEFGCLAIVFNDTLKRLQDSFDRLRRFTADASHELRTPLTALRSVGEVGLSNDADLASCRNVIGSMLEEADRLAFLVDNLLTLTRFDSSKSYLELESLNLASLVNDVVECLGVLAEEKGQILSVETGQIVNIKANPVTLRQALINLLDNAIKYTPGNGCIRIVVKQTCSGEAIAEIIDNGPGISPEHHSGIFDRFYRIEKGRSSEKGGTGLGLAIACRGVEENGGRIELESKQGEGSTFRIILPAEKGAGAA